LPDLVGQAFLPASLGNGGRQECLPHLTETKPADGRPRAFCFAATVESELR